MFVLLFRNKLQFRLTHDDKLIETMSHSCYQNKDIQNTKYEILLQILTYWIWSVYSVSSPHLAVISTC